MVPAHRLTSGKKEERDGWREGDGKGGREEEKQEKEWERKEKILVGTKGGREGEKMGKGERDCYNFVA